MKKALVIFRSLFFVIGFSFGCCSLIIATPNMYNIIPYPQQLIPQSGKFTFNKRTIVLCPFQNVEIRKLAQQFSDQITLVSGLRLTVMDIASADSTNAVVFEPTTIDKSGAESYRLNISAKTIRIQASTANGFFYGLQTIYQLLPPEIYGHQQSTVKKWSIPAVQILDEPRFAYRGLHLDVCRHFFPVEFIKKYIDAMAIHKLNYFHWHLTDDQGWRIEIKKYPRLTGIGSQRAETMVGYYYDFFPQQFDGKAHGGFYTQAEAREIVAYAKDRFITVIPEIEMPGHAQAAIASYPFLSCTQDSTVKVVTKWGVFKEVFCPRDTTFGFLQDVLTEIMDIFPGKYIHIGGDECPKDRWKSCPDCQALIKAQNLKDENGLQSYFIHRIEHFLNSKGRKIIGWDEILDGGLDPNATVMSWRGIQGGITAAKAGNDVIMTPGAYCYFDKYQADPAEEPITIGGYLPIQTVYSYEPVPAELNADQAKHILGAQANVWSEYLPTTESVEYMAFPRVSALAEVLWSNKNIRNWEMFSERMPTEFKRYEQLDIKPSKVFYDVRFQTNLTSGNKLQITLLCDCSDAQIRYTLNGKTTIYKEPFTLTESADVTALALVGGKQPGKSITKHFVVSKLTGLSYTQIPFNTGYKGENTYSLTDGIVGNTKTTNQWVGIGGSKDGEFVVDLLQVQPVSRFSVGLLSAPALCGMYPAEISLFTSLDGNVYNPVASETLTPHPSGAWEICRPELIFPVTNARYIKLILKSAGKCFNNDNATGKSHLFLDEMGLW